MTANVDQAQMEEVSSAGFCGQITYRSTSQVPAQLKAATPEFWTRPVLHVRNLRKSITYYCHHLGFVTDWLDTSSSEPACGQVSRGGLSIVLNEGAAFPKASVPAVLSLTLKDSPEAPGLEALHRELVAAGGRVSRAPVKVHWDEQVYEMYVEDLDGNVLMFWGNMPAV